MLPAFFFLLKSTDSASKRVQLLREDRPWSPISWRSWAIPGDPNVMLEVSGAQATARTFGLDVTTAEMRQTADVNSSHVRAQLLKKVDPDAVRRLLIRL